MNIDKEVIEAIQKGERAVIHKLYHHTFNLLMGKAVRYYRNREDQMTIVNNSFLKIVTKIDQFKPGTSYFSWANIIVQRVIIDEFRKNKKYNEQFNSVEDFTGLDIEDEYWPDNEYDIDQLMNLIDGLPNATKIVFNLFAIDDYSPKEIADELGISYETVKWHIKEARKRLRISLINSIPNTQL